MEQLIQHLSEIFALDYPGSQMQLSQTPSTMKVGGFILWDGFEDKTQIERQRMVWQTLRERLPVQDQQRITAILTLTPLEHTSILEDEDDDIAETNPLTTQNARPSNGSGNGKVGRNGTLAETPKVEMVKVRLEELLRGAFEGGETELETEPRPAKISGYLVWDGFQNERQLDRQRRLWRVLSESLPAADQKRITVILTVTPDEMRSLREVE